MNSGTTNEKSSTSSILFNNPATIKSGANITVYPNNTDVNNEKSLDNETILSDLEEGIIGVSKELPIDTPSDNLFKFELTNLPSESDKVVLQYELYGVQDHDAVSRSINDRMAVGGYIVKQQAAWSHQTEEISANWCKSSAKSGLI
jgi:hypothetical protein